MTIATTISGQELDTIMSGNGSLRSRKANGEANVDGVLKEQIDGLSVDKSSSGSPQTTTNLLICVGGIYASLYVLIIPILSTSSDQVKQKRSRHFFQLRKTMYIQKEKEPLSSIPKNPPTNTLQSLTWGVLQERITTTPHGLSGEKFKSPVFINTIQSLFAATLGYIYLLYSRRTSSTPLPVFPSTSIITPMLLVAITSSLASPFGYAALSHVDYITFILAKSCKLLPVMFLHVTLFRRKYPLYKYGVVFLVTAGVAVFTLHHPSSAKKSKGGASGNSSWGMLLLAINLLFDGLTNSTQDYIYKAYRPYTGQQMMCALNVLSTGLTGAYLVFAPWVAVNTPLGAYFGIDARNGGELVAAVDFIRRYPAVGWDVVAFAACGALGQVFICELLLYFLLPASASMSAVWV